jgi:hypothetical protein
MSMSAWPDKPSWLFAGTVLVLLVLTLFLVWFVNIQEAAAARRLG